MHAADNRIGQTGAITVVAAAVKSGLRVLNFVDLAKVKGRGEVRLANKNLKDADMPIVAAMLSHPESKFTVYGMSKLSK